MGFTRKTRVLTDKGYKLAKQIVEGDKVLAEGEYKKITEVCKTDITRLYSLSTAGTFPLFACFSQPIFARRFRGKSVIAKGICEYEEPRYEALADLVPMWDYVGIPVITTEENPNMLSLEDCNLLGHYFAINDPNRKKQKRLASILEKAEGQIPMEILNLPKSHLDSFFAGYVTEKNCLETGHDRFTITADNPTVLESFQLLLCKIFHKAAVARSLYGKGYALTFDGDSPFSFYDKLYDFVWVPVISSKATNEHEHTYDIANDNEGNNYCVINNLGSYGVA